MSGFGDLMNPGGQPGQEPAEGTWSDLVKDPIARSALMGFGLQMMTGGWGNGTQQLAAGLGAGATSGAATSEAMQKQLEADDKSASADANHAANRENALKVAKIGADSRAEVAGIRAEASNYRASLTAAARSPNEAKFLADAMNKYMSEEKKNQPLSRKSDQQIEMEASQYAQNQLALIRASGKPVGDQGESAASNSPNPSPGAGTAVQGQSPVPGAAGKTTAQNPALEKIYNRPDVQQLLQTPEGQDTLRKQNPSAAQMLIDEHNRRSKPAKPDTKASEKKPEQGALGKLWGNLTKDPNKPWQE